MTSIHLLLVSNESYCGRALRCARFKAQPPPASAFLPHAVGLCGPLGWQHQQHYVPSRCGLGVAHIKGDRWRPLRLTTIRSNALLFLDNLHFYPDAFSISGRGYAVRTKQHGTPITALPCSNRTPVRQSIRTDATLKKLWAWVDRCALKRKGALCSAYQMVICPHSEFELWCTPILLRVHFGRQSDRPGDNLCPSIVIVLSWYMKAYRTFGLMAYECAWQVRRGRQTTASSV